MLPGLGCAAGNWAAPPEALWDASILAWTQGAKTCSEPKLASFSHFGVPGSPGSGRAAWHPAQSRRPGLAASVAHCTPALPPSRSPSCQEPVADPAVWAGPASQTQREGPCLCVSCPESRQGFAYLIWWKLERTRDFANRNFAGVETKDFPMKYSSVRNVPCHVFYD